MQYKMWLKTDSLSVAKVGFRRWQSSCTLFLVLLWRNSKFTSWKSPVEK